MPSIRDIMGSSPAFMQMLFAGVATAADLGSLGAVSLTMASIGIAASAVTAIGLISQSKHEKECGEIRSFVEQTVRQQGDWRRGLEDLLTRNGIAPGAITTTDPTNPLVQFGLLLTGTQDQIKSMLDKNAGLVVELQRSVETNLPEIARLAKLTRDDVRRVLTEQRESVKSLKELARVLTRVEGMVTPRPTLVLPEVFVQPGDERGNPFVFSERFVPLVGRTALMGELHRFLNQPNISATRCKPNFAWWWMHGEGGCGKSRVAHELCIDARALGWHAGRLEVHEPFADWNKWQVDQPTLMVIDYAGDRGEAPALLIDTLAKRAAELSRPVRVLLLDRSRTESLDKRLKEGMSAGGASAIGQREHLSDGALRPLDEADLRSLVGFAHFWFKGDMPDLDRAYAVLRTIDPQPSYFTPTSTGYQWRARPLYACVLGYAISRVGLDKVETWSGDELLDWVLKQERRHWKAAGVLEHHVHAAVLATLTKSLPLPVDPESAPFGELAKDGLLPTGEYGELAGATHMAAFAGGAVSSASGVARAMPDMPPITPDILGERFILDRLAGELSCDGSTGQTVVRDTKRLICAALRHAPAAAVDFVDRAVRDFANHKHAAQLWTACPDSALPGATEADLLGKVIQRLFRRGRAQEAMGLMQRLAELHQASPQDKATTGPFTDALHTMGSALRSAAQHESAMQFFQMALAANLEAFGEQDARTATSLNYVGRVLYDTGKSREAIEAFRASEAINRAVFGDAHPNVAISVNNVGGALKALGDAKGALEKFREAERIDRAVFGDAHPNVAISVNNVGGALKALGDAKGALEKYSEVERIFRAVFGDAHPNVATAVNNVGSALQALGDVKGALEKYREAERIDRAVFGDAHPNVATRVNNVGGALKALGDAKGALEKYSEVERIFRAVFGDAHPNVAISVNNVGGALKALGDAKGALEKYREAERIDRAVFGDAHPEVATDVNNVGGALHALGDAKGASACHMDAFKILSQTVGPQHPDTVTTLIALLTLGEHGLAALSEVFPPGVVQQLADSLKAVPPDSATAKPPDGPLPSVEP
jgi:tetratricopeptide (TPR) repeat protein